MQVRFWGTRGSLPTPLDAAGVRRKLKAALLKAADHKLTDEASVEAFIDAELDFATSGTFGGNSACVELVTGADDGTYNICDLGSGARVLGNQVLAQHGPAKHHVFNVFQSHPHWDHIMGFPFFTPAYIPGNTIRIHGGHDATSILEEAFRRQQSQPCFPVDFDQLGATIEFVTLEPGRHYQIGGLDVQLAKQFHSGDSYGYRFERDGKSVVYATDCEHKVEQLGPDYPFVAFYRGADLVIFDAMYALAESISVKEDWGHSSNIVAVEICLEAGVKHLCMTHHEPVFDDEQLQRILKETIRYEEIARRGAQPLRVSSAHDGLELTV